MPRLTRPSEPTVSALAFLASCFRRAKQICPGWAEEHKICVFVLLPAGALVSNELSRLHAIKKLAGLLMTGTEFQRFRKLTGRFGKALFVGEEHAIIEMGIN